MYVKEYNNRCPLSCYEPAKALSFSTLGTATPPPPRPDDMMRTCWGAGGHESGCSDAGPCSAVVCMPVTNFGGRKATEWR